MLKECDVLEQAVLNSLTAMIAVLDEDGMIVAVNDQWTRSARRRGDAATMSKMGVGVNYLEVCRRVSVEANPEVQGILAGIEAVLRNSLPDFSSEYSCHSPATQRWFCLSVTPLDRGRGGAVIAQPTSPNGEGGGVSTPERETMPSHDGAGFRRHPHVRL